MFLPRYFVRVFPSKVSYRAFSAHFLFLKLMICLLFWMYSTVYSLKTPEDNKVYTKPIILSHLEKVCIAKWSAISASFLEKEQWIKFNVSSASITIWVELLLTHHRMSPIQNPLLGLLAVSCPGDIAVWTALRSVHSRNFRTCCNEYDYHYLNAFLLSE